MKLQYLSIILVIISSLGYHICQKTTPSGINPIAALIVTYTVALIFSIVVFFVAEPKLNIVEEIKEINRTSILLGFAVVGLELGFLLAYRSGWDVRIASLLANTTVALFLIPIGLLFFKEAMNLTNMSGVLLCITGLILISK